MFPVTSHTLVKTKYLRKRLLLQKQIVWEHVTPLHLTKNVGNLKACTILNYYVTKVQSLRHVGVEADNKRERLSLMSSFIAFCCVRCFVLSQGQYCSLL